MSAAEEKAIAELTVRALKAMYTDTSYTLFFNIVDRFRELTGMKSSNDPT